MMPDDYRLYFVEHGFVSGAPIPITAADDVGAGIGLDGRAAGAGVSVDATATDPEGATPVYSITGGADAARFTIDGATGAVRISS